MKIPTIFFGASSYVIPLLGFLKNDYDLKLVVTTEQKPTDAVPLYCLKNNIPSISLKSFKDPLWQDGWKAEIENWKLDFAVLADFGLLVPQSVLEMFSKGIINIHPSLLPEFRGPTPGTSAILHGKTITGVSLMLLDRELDHGPLLGQVSSAIKPDDTSATLYPRLFEEGTELLKKVLPEYIGGTLKPIEQDHSKATYTEPHLTRESGFIEFEKLPTIQPAILERTIRAYFPWPGVWTKVNDAHSRLDGKIVKLLPRHPGQSEGSHPLKKDSSPVVQNDIREKLLLQVEGKKPMGPKDFLNGYPDMKEWIEKISGQ